MTHKADDSHLTPDRPPLDRWRFDAIAEPNKPLWGLDQIARAVGLSRDTVRRLARDPAVPITRPTGAGMYFAYKSDLLAWLRGADAAETRQSSTPCNLPNGG